MKSSMAPAAGSWAQVSQSLSFDATEDATANSDCIVCGIDTETDNTPEEDESTAIVASDDQERDWLREAIPELTRSDDSVRKVVSLKLALASDPTDVDAVAQSLQHCFFGFGVFVREATGTRNKAACLTRLRHKSIVLKPYSPTSTDCEVIVELAFRDAFTISSPTPRYQQVLDLLPSVYAAPTPCFLAAVKFVAAEMSQSFLAKGQVVPPWRTFPALRSKWCRALSRDSPIIPCVRTPSARPTALMPDPTPQHRVVGFVDSSAAHKPAGFATRHATQRPDTAAQVGKRSTLQSVSPGPGHQSPAKRGCAMLSFTSGPLFPAPGLGGERVDSGTVVAAHRTQPRASHGQTAVPLDQLLLPVRTVKLGGCIA